MASIRLIEQYGMLGSGQANLLEGEENTLLPTVEDYSEDNLSINSSSDALGVSTPLSAFGALDDFLIASWQTKY